MGYQICVGRWTEHIANYTNHHNHLSQLIIGMDMILIELYCKVRVIVKIFFGMYVWELQEGLMMRPTYDNLHSTKNNEEGDIARTSCHNWKITNLTICGGWLCLSYFDLNWKAFHCSNDKNCWEKCIWWEYEDKMSTYSICFRNIEE